MKTIDRLSIPLSALALLAVASPSLSPASEAPPSFEKDIRPLFAARCAACHSPEVEHLKGKLDLSTLASALKGGGTGPSLVPGKPEESYLLQLLTGAEEPRMPPKDFKPLNAEEIELVKWWIAESLPAEAAAIAANPAPVAPPAVPKPAPADDAFKAFMESESAPSPAPAAAKPAFEPVSALAFSPKGGLLAQGGIHKVTLYSIDAATGAAAPAGILEGHAELVRALAFSPDGALLAAAGGKPGREGEIIVWRLADKTISVAIKGHKDNIQDVVFSPDGKLLATCSYDKLVKLWDAATGEEKHSFKDHVDAVFAVAFSPDGKLLASAAGDRAIKVWDVAEGKRLFTLSDSLGAVYAVAFSPSGKLLAGAGADKMIRVWDIDQGNQAFTQTSLTGANQIKSAFAHDLPVLRLVYSPDGKTIYTASEDNRIKAWNAETLVETIAIEPQPDSVTSLALSPDGALLAAGRFDASRVIYDAASGKQLSIETAAKPAPPEEKAAAMAAPAGRKKIESLDVDNVVIDGKVPASLQSINPSVIAKGTKVTIELRGISLDDPEFFITNPEIKSTLVSNEKLPIAELKRPKGDTGAFLIDNAQTHKLTLEVEATANAPSGKHAIMARTYTGMTNPLEITVAPWTDAGEKEPNNAAGEEQPLAIPGAAAGALNAAGDPDRYKVSAREGQEIVFVLSGTATTLKLIDSAGKELASGGQRLGYKFPAAGDYVVEASDPGLAQGSYRLAAGEFPYVTEFNPPRIPAGPPVKIAVKGFNLGGAAEIELDPPDDVPFGKTVALPIPGVEGNPIPAPEIAVGKADEIAEVEPNNTASQAQAIPFPANVSGRIKPEGEGASSDDDVFRLHAVPGETMLIETSAARSGSPLDTIIEILDANGKPLPWVTVRCVAETIMTLSDRDSASAGLRIENWTGMKVNDYAMIGSEVLQIRRLPGYADEDIQLKAWPNGQRRGWFGTTPEHHAVSTPFYRVEIHPPGASFPPNGLPSHTLYWRNDDTPVEGAPPGDSMLEFSAPAEGDYYLRVRDARGEGGDAYAYGLTLRRPAPDYDLAVGNYWPSVPEGGALAINVRARRRDGFNAPVALSVEGVPEGFEMDGDVILEGEEEVQLALRAKPGAQSTPFGSTFKVVATAMVNGAEVRREGRIGAVTVRRSPDMAVHNEVASVAIKPGQTGEIGMRIDRFNGFTSRVPVNVLNLPFGVQVIDTGLNGILVRDHETGRRMKLYCEPWVPPMRRKIYVQTQMETRSTRPVFIGPPIELVIGDPPPSASNVAAVPAAGGLTPERFLEAIR